MLLNHYCHIIINNFKKLSEQKDAKNTLKIATPIFLIISIYIELTKFLEVDLLNAYMT